MNTTPTHLLDLFVSSSRGSPHSSPPGMRLGIIEVLADQFQSIEGDVVLNVVGAIERAHVLNQELPISPFAIDVTYQVRDNGPVTLTLGQKQGREFPVDLRDVADDGDRRLVVYGRAGKERNTVDSERILSLSFVVANFVKTGYVRTVESEPIDNARVDGDPFNVPDVCASGGFEVMQVTAVSAGVPIPQFRLRA
ncbi:hypothetical protein K466DRAFT_596226 [Polyporus arcularius HHB13444]|uniref:Uncharacterized protein n=1 Tax=Polyporus arcularius HHB13444 TaxID=1314778 RepID=A0A5C3PU42_9APHY|nr:hypothetical protein K466DRAFT_596226 [Polyporus arcularius HHB13444]